MVHFYGEITAREIYNIIQEELQDFRTLWGSVEHILKRPSKYGLSVE